MHRIVSSHLKEFVKNFSLGSDSETTQFEKFAIYSVIVSRYICTCNLDNITTEDCNDRINGIAVIVDKNLIMSEKDVFDLFKLNKQDSNIDIICVQAKANEGFDYGNFLKYKDGIFRLIRDNQTQADAVETACAFRPLHGNVRALLMHTALQALIAA